MAALVEHAEGAERWASVPGYEGLYEASDWGRVRSLVRKSSTRSVVRGIPLVMSPLRRGKYQSYTLYRDGKGRAFYLHLLVLRAFVGEAPAGHEGAHDDGDRENNRLSNLLWKTHADNMRDQVRHGTRRLGEAKVQAKLTDEIVRQLRAHTSRGVNSEARRLGVAPMTISRARNGKTWRHV